MIEITLVKLQDTIPYDAGLLPYISDERRLKILRFQNPKDKKRSLAAELLIRMAAFHSLGIAPLRTKISYNEYGKPYIANVRGFKFNVSHSGNYVVLAKSSQKIGIDIEYRKETDFSVAKRCYTEAEYTYVTSFDSPEQRLDAFYQLWTLKESYIKAIGKGLKIPLRSIEFEIGAAIKGKTLKQEPFKFFSRKVDRYMLSCCFLETGDCKSMHCIDEQELYGQYRTLLARY